MDKAGRSGVFAESPTLGDTEREQRDDTTLKSHAASDDNYFVKTLTRDGLRWSQAMLPINRLADISELNGQVDIETIDFAIEGLDATKALLLEIRNRERV